MAKFYGYIQFEQTLSELLKKVSLRKFKNLFFTSFRKEQCFIGICTLSTIKPLIQ